MFQAVPPPIIRSTKLYVQRQVLSNQWDEMKLCSISSTIAAGSSIGLTISDAVCTVLCSWWWAEETPETCRASYGNKQIEKMLLLVGCTLEIHLRCTNIWTSNLQVPRRATNRKTSWSISFKKKVFHSMEFIIWMHDFRLSPRSRWELRSSVLLRSES
jgi:hypothetical protein